MSEEYQKKLAGDHIVRIHVASPGETASFLMTGYIFMSNDTRIACQSREQLQGYLDAYKILLERTLGTTKPLFPEN